MSTSRQFIKFLFVGVLNTLFGYAVFAALVFAGVPSVPALVATYVVGVTFNYFTTGRIVFQQAGWGAFARFVLAYVIIYFVNLALFRLVESFGAGPLLAQALCLPPVAVFSFLLFRTHVFRTPAPPKDEPQ